MKITGYQVFWMMIGLNLGMTILLTLSPMIAEAKQDAWISTVISGGISLFIASVATRLSLLHPDQTLIEFSQTILGRWLGKIIVIPYFIMWNTVIAIILRQFGEALQIMVLPLTPLWVIMLIILLLTTHAVYSRGIVTVARSSEVLGPIIVLLVSIVLLLSINHLKISKLLPVYYDTGWLSIVKGSLSPASFLGECVMMTMLMSFMRDPRKGPRSVMLGMGLASFFIVLSTLLVLLTIGSNLSGKMLYPFFEATRVISLFQFIENIDAIVIVIWLSSIYIKLSLYLFINSYGMAQWLEIKNWRHMIWLISPFVFVMALLPKNIVESSINYPTTFWLPYVFTINMLAIPLLLWIVGILRKKLKAAGS